MKKLIFCLLTAILLCSCKTQTGNVSGNTDEITVNLNEFINNDFVTVIPQGQTCTIPDGKNCTPIDDLFLDNRSVTLSNYSMCRYEVSQALYKQIMGKVPYTDIENLYDNETQNLRPAAGINWYEAIIFCNKLSDACGLENVFTIKDIKISNKGKENEYVRSANISWDFSKNGFRLPTEAEWEFASRGAGISAEDWKYKFSGGDISKKVAWTELNSSGYSDDDETCRTHEIGLKKPNALGIYDMSGNVSEWCLDWYRSVTEVNDFSHGNAVRDSGAVTDPCLSKGKYDNHVIRGGAYNQGTGYASNWQRLSAAPYAGYGFDGSANQGIRLVKRP